MDLNVQTRSRVHANRIILFNHSGVKGLVAMIQDGKTMKVKNDKLGSINFFLTFVQKKKSP